MNENNIDKRNIGGARMAAKFEIVLPRVDIFRQFNEKLTGTMVFNVRGGCVFFDNSDLMDYKNQLFPNGPVTTVKTLHLTGSTGTKIKFEDIKIRFVREKMEGTIKGIVFKLVQLSESHMDRLNNLQDALPSVERDEEILDSLQNNELFRKHG